MNIYLTKAAFKKVDRFLNKIDSKLNNKEYITKKDIQKLNEIEGILLSTIDFAKDL